MLFTYYGISTSGVSFGPDLGQLLPVVLGCGKQLLGSLPGDEFNDLPKLVGAIEHHAANVDPIFWIAVFKQSKNFLVTYSGDW